MTVEPIFGNAAAEYIRAARVKKSEKTWKREEKILNEILLPVFKDEPLDYFFSGAYAATIVNTLTDRDSKEVRRAFPVIHRVLEFWMRTHLRLPRI